MASQLGKITSSSQLARPIPLDALIAILQSAGVVFTNSDGRLHTSPSNFFWTPNSSPPTLFVAGGNLYVGVSPVDALNGTGTLVIQTNNPVGVGHMSWNGTFAVGAGAGLSPGYARTDIAAFVGTVDGSTTSGAIACIRALGGTLRFSNPSGGEINLTSGIATVGALGTEISFGVNTAGAQPAGLTPVKQFRVLPGFAKSVDSAGTSRDVLAKNSPNWGLASAPATATRRFIASGGSSLAPLTTEPASSWLCVNGGNITSFSAAIAGTAMTTDNLTFTVRVNGSDTAATVTITHGTTTATITGLNVNIPANALVTVAINQTATEAQANLDARCAFGYQ